MQNTTGFFNIFLL